MRMSELLAATVSDETGQVGGRIRDVRIIREAAAAEGQVNRFEVAGLVIGGGPLVHRLGFAEGRARGPLLLRLLTRDGTRAARFIPVARVTQWGTDRVRVSGRLQDLPRLVDMLDQ